MSSLIRSAEQVISSLESDLLLLFFTFILLFLVECCEMIKWMIVKIVKLIKTIQNRHHLYTRKEIIDIVGLLQNHQIDDCQNSQNCQN